MTSPGERIRRLRNLAGRPSQNDPNPDTKHGGRDAGPRTLVILSTPRSGTHLLAHHLEATGQIGLAEEFFHDQLMSEFGERFDHDPGDLAGYTRAWHEQTAAASDMAAVVVFPDHVDKLAASGQLASAGPSGFDELLAKLPDPSVVLLERQSLLQQAVSFNRATQSWIWTRQAGQEAPPHPNYDFESLTAHLTRLVTIREWALAAAAGQQQLVDRLSYEQVAGNPQLAANQLCEQLGLAPDGGGASTPPPVRAADEESQQRVKRLGEDLAALTSRLRWSPRQSAPEASTVVDDVAAASMTIANRQLTAFSEAVDAHRASAFRRRPLLDAPVDAGSVSRLHAALAAADPGSRQLQVLTHGLDPWLLGAMYADATKHNIALSLTDQWSTLSATDIVHINSMTMGWGHVGFDAKKALIERARAVLRALHENDTTIIWSVNEPITPGTNHIALESAIRQELAKLASVIHVPNEHVLERSQALFSVDADRLVVGELGASPIVEADRTEADAVTVAVLGSLTAASHLGDIAPLIDALQQKFERPVTLVVAGTDGGIGSVAHHRSQLGEAGAVVVEGHLDAALAGEILSTVDVVLIPCAAEATYIPAQAVLEQHAIPYVATQCSAMADGQGADWSNPSPAADLVVERVRRTTTAPAGQSTAVTIGQLIEAAQ